MKEANEQGVSLEEELGAPFLERRHLCRHGFAKTLSTKAANGQGVSLEERLGAPQLRFFRRLNFSRVWVSLGYPHFS